MEAIENRFLKEYISLDDEKINDPFADSYALYFRSLKNKYFFSSEAFKISS